MVKSDDLTIEPATGSFSGCMATKSENHSYVGRGSSEAADSSLTLGLCDKKEAKRNKQTRTKKGKKCSPYKNTTTNKTSYAA